MRAALDVNGWWWKLETLVVVSYIAFPDPSSPLAVELTSTSHLLFNDSGLDNKLCEKDGGVVSAYVGFDATADSLHVGSLLQVWWMSLSSCPSY